MFNQPNAAPEYKQIPPRVCAAQSYLQFAAALTEGQINHYAAPGDAPRESGRTLTQAEQAAYNAALQCLTLYFNGECDYGDSPPQFSNGEDGDDEPKVPVTV